MNDPDFWSDKKKSDEAMREAKTLRARLDRLARQIRLLHDAIARWSARAPDGPAA